MQTQTKHKPNELYVLFLSVSTLERFVFLPCPFLSRLPFPFLGQDQDTPAPEAVASGGGPP